MKITPNVKAVILSGLRTKGIKKADLTRGLGRPNNYASKLFDGTLKNIDDDDADKICDFLDVSFLEVTEKGKRIPASAIRLAAAMDASPKLAGLIECLLTYLNSDDEEATNPPRRAITDGTPREKQA